MGRARLAAIRGKPSGFASYCERGAGGVLIQHGVKPHDLRHAFAIRLYRKTRDLLLTRQALRHKSIVSTLAYARMEEVRLRDLLAS